jgi:hypothetical protein
MLFQFIGPSSESVLHPQPKPPISAPARAVSPCRNSHCPPEKFRGWRSRAKARLGHALPHCTPPFSSAAPPDAWFQIFSYQGTVSTQVNPPRGGGLVDPGKRNSRTTTSPQGRQCFKLGRRMRVTLARRSPQGRQCFNLGRRMRVTRRCSACSSLSPLSLT